MRRAATVVAALAAVLLSGCGGGDEPGGGGAGDCVGDTSGQRVQQGVDGSLDDGMKLRVSFLATDGDDGAYVRWAPGAGGDPSPEPVRVGLGDSFTLGGTSYELTGVCDDAAWVTADG